MSEVSTDVGQSKLTPSFTFSAINPKARIGEQSAHNEIDFPTIEMLISLPPTVQLQSSAMRGLWLNYDHFSDYCSSFQLRHERSQKASEYLRKYLSPTPPNILFHSNLKADQARVAQAQGDSAIDAGRVRARDTTF